jgi:DNA transformation protein
MARTSELCDYIVDRLAPLGAASYRFMFGGFGIYLDGLMIAIVADETLLLRADEENRGDYEARGIGPFQPFAGKTHSMPFYLVPDDIFEDQDEFLVWADRSRAAAVRVQACKAKKAGRKKKG